MAKSKIPPSRVKKRSSRSSFMRKLNSNFKKNVLLKSEAAVRQQESQILTEVWPSTSDSLLHIDNGEQSRNSPSPMSCDEDLPPLEIEVDNTPQITLQTVINGRRVVNLAHVLSQYEKVVLHQLRCTMGRMKILREKLNGLSSTLHFHCENCNKTMLITSDPVQEKGDLNSAVTWGSLSIGIGFSQLEELFALLDVPIMCSKSYKKQVTNIKENWQDIAFQEMENAGKEEKAEALKNGHIIDGLPYITVIGDGGWSKRSYGHSFNAKSGVAIIVGAFTKKPLFIGVRNKYCSTCIYYEKRKVAPKKHSCALNFHGPSTAMEYNVIVEGFSKSIEQHGLMYKKFIGDGDSNVMYKIQEQVSYGHMVEKIECANHMIKNLNSKLYTLCSKTAYPSSMRNLLSKQINGQSRRERLIIGVRMAIKQNSDPKLLTKDLENAPHHVFGDHVNCSEYFCKKKNDTDETKNLSVDFFNEIKKAMNPLVNKAHSLIFNETTNQAERFMSLVNKFTGGKRVDFTRGNAFTTRALGATLAHSFGPAWHLKALKSIKKPGVITGKIFSRRDKVHLQRKNTRKNHGRSSKKQKVGTLDFNYGQNATKEDMGSDELQRGTEAFLEKLENVVLSEHYLQIEMETRGQHNVSKWHEIRKRYLTASNFGAVVKRKKSTCASLVKRILYPKELNTRGVLYGRIHENTARNIYDSMNCTKIKDCGFFIDKNHYYLGATPDGTIGDDGIVEIKCLESVKGKFHEHPNISRSCYYVENNDIRLRRNHNYYYQIQGQLNIANKSFCDFILYAANDFHVERIYKDSNFWEVKMLPKLANFYLKCVLPEIIDPRVIRHLPIREPSHN